MSIRVVVVDDDPFVCGSLKTILGAQEDMDVVDTGTDGHQAVELFERYAPDILLMDIQMPDGDGLSAAQTILERHPDARIVFLTTFSDDEFIVRALRLGARGYLIKQDVANIAPALRSVVSGSSVLAGEVIGRMDSLIVGRTRTDAGEPDGGAHAGDDRGDKGFGTDDMADPMADPDSSAIPGLTDRENQIVGCIARGLDNRQIADLIHISEGTVRNHISVILQKLDLKNRTQIAVCFYRRQR